MEKPAKDIKKLVDISKIDALMQKFTAATGTGNALMGLNGEILSASGWQPLCTQFFRKHPKTEKNCLESDTFLANALKEHKRFNLYQCKNGLTDVAIPVYISGDHLANLFIGQFFLKQPDRAFFEALADQYGFDKTEFMRALEKIPVIPEDMVMRKIDFLQELAVLIGEMGLNRLQLQTINRDLEARMEQKIRQIKDSQTATLNIMQDVQEARLEAEHLNIELDKIITELKDSNEQLERFAYVASHDLQEPLRKVNSFTQLFERRYHDLVDEKGQKYIYYIKDGTLRMQQLISDLLQYSRINTKGAEFKKINTTKIVEDIKDLFDSKLNETNGKIVMGDLPDIYGDESQIRQLFQNLVGNAIKFRKKGVDPEITIRAEKAGGNWVFKVKDNGIGIEEAYKDRIFVIFQRLHSKEAYEGTGIGLAICQQILKRHGGEISLTSEPGNGTEFFFTIPTIEKAMGREQSPIMKGEKTDGNN
jgi:signal transduction histidine kinase